MAQNAQQWLLAPVVHLDITDSTNNYAMQLIDADTAQTGTTVTAEVQTAGRGQRGRTWADSRGRSLLMSIIVTPQYGLDAQFVFSACVAVTVAEVLESIYQPWQVQIKWPNDIIVNAKKAAGILIENVLRGSSWPYAIVGLGINVLQDDLGAELPHATSLRRESGILFPREELFGELRSCLLRSLSEPRDAAAVMNAYNARLFCSGQSQVLVREGQEAPYVIREVRADGQLVTTSPQGRTECFRHGDVTWKWG